MYVETKKERNSSFDVIKCFAAFMVVSIHFTPHDSFVGIYINALCRMAVPIFFVITGYYYDSLKAAGKLGDYLRKILYLTIFASAFYFLFHIVQLFFEGGLSQWLRETYNFKNIVLWLILNSDPTSGHLWYLYALIYTIIINIVADKFNLTKLLFIAAVFLLLLHCVLNFTCYCIFIRNWLFMGIPFVMLGRYLSIMREEVRSWYFDMKTMIVVAISCLVLLCFEIRLYEYVFAGKLRELYFFIVPLVLITVIYAIRNPQLGSNTFLAHIGQKYSTHIYIYHVALGILLLELNKNDCVFYQYTMTIVIYIVTLLISYIYQKLTFKRIS